MSFKENKAYSLPDYVGDSRRAVNRFIILHESGNESDANSETSLLNEVKYMYNNFNNAYTTHFVGCMNGEPKVYQIGTPGYVSWGALDANPYAPIQVEFARTTNKENFKKAYKLYIEVARYYATLYGIPLTLDQGGVNTAGIKSHQWVTNNFGGDHVDPYPYFESMGITKEQLAHDLLHGVSENEDSKDSKPNTVSNVVTVTDNRYKAYTMYDKHGNAYVGSDITTGSSWLSSEIIPIGNDNYPYYRISTNGYIPQSITNFKDSITINLPADQHAYTVDDLGEKTNDTKLDATLLGGSSWRYDGTVYPMKNGVVAYLIASNRFLPVQFAQGSGYSEK